MAYNPLIHKRKSIRLKGYDYSKCGIYYITICCHARHCRFGEIINDEMVLNEHGKIANDEWGKLTQRFQNFELDIFQIMPNHIHGIIVLTNPAVGAPLAAAPDDADTPFAATPNDADATSSNEAGVNKGAGVNPAPTNPTVGDIVGAHKSLVANTCLEIFKTKNEPMGKLWQRNYYEHIIKNERSYHRIAEYILNNPANWQQDKLFN